MNATMQAIIIHPQDFELQELRNWQQRRFLHQLPDRSIEELAHEAMLTGLMLNVQRKNDLVQRDIVEEGLPQMKPDENNAAEEFTFTPEPTNDELTYAYMRDLLDPLRGGISEDTVIMMGTEYLNDLEGHSVPAYRIMERAARIFTQVRAEVKPHFRMEHK